jgi:hypothetical protein
VVTVMSGDYTPDTEAVLQGDDLATQEEVTQMQRVHVASPDCWCHPSEDEPGVFVHHHEDDGARQ